MRLAEIWIYPVKSLGGIRVRRHEHLPTGLRGDRRWMVISEEGKFLTQREIAEMARVRLRLESGRIVMETPGGDEELEGPSEERVATQVWNSAVDARTEKNPRAARFLSEFLARPVRLVTAGPEFRRPVRDREWADGTQVFFADSTPLLVTTRPSLQDLNRRLAEPVPMDRFRPNLVLDGDFEAFAEDAWTGLRLGPLQVRLARECDRCPIVTIDQAEGRKVSAEPLKTLAGFRRKGTKVYFGIRGWADESGWLEEGQPFEPLK